MSIDEHYRRVLPELVARFERGERNLTHESLAELTGLEVPLARSLWARLEAHGVVRTDFYSLPGVSALRLDCSVIEPKVIDEYHRLTAPQDRVNLATQWLRAHPVLSVTVIVLICFTFAMNVANGVFELWANLREAFG